jgi:AraC-like DNA-binding protein
LSTYVPQQTGDYLDSTDGRTLSGEHQEVLPLSEGELLILRADGRDLHQMESVEIADTCSFGFHSGNGGALRFDERRPFEVDDGDCVRSFVPRGLTSRFTPPAGPFHVFLALFSPDQALAFCEARGICARQFGVPGDFDTVRTGKTRPLSGAGRAVLSGLTNSPYHGPARRLHLESGVLALLAETLAMVEERDTALVPHDRRRLEEVRELLEAQRDHPPSIMELARAAGMNDFKLKRDFKRLFGVTPHAYARNLRLDDAARALREGQPVKAAAAEAGYACPSRFTQAFRKRHGVLPREWR